MVAKEFYRVRQDGVSLYRTFSDNGFLIQKVGTNEIYEEAIDVQTAEFIYEETLQKVGENT